jgi:hypothetical protein
MQSFSEDLISRLKKYFKDRYNLTITTDQSVVFLSSMADLYDFMSRSAASQRAPQVGAREARSVTLDI